MRKDYKNGYFEGELNSAGQREKGTFYFNNGDKYEGRYINDKKYGIGVYTFADGNFYRGMFENDPAVCRQTPGRRSGSQPESCLPANYDEP